MMNRTYAEFTHGRFTMVWVKESDKEKFDNGEIVKSTVWSIFSREHMVMIVLPSSQTYSAYRNGRPYVQNKDWTWEQIDRFEPF